jgi:hypothetical protein
MSDHVVAGNPLLLSLITPVLYGLITSALYYLGSRAKITEFIWSRYPKGMDKFMLCAACTGFWYGLGVALVLGWTLELPFLGLAGRFWATPIVVAITSIVFTPLFANAHVTALYQTSPGPELEVPTSEELDGHAPQEEP